MQDSIFDLIVIGGGPGGYVAAIRAAQLGMKVACVDKRAALGGTCLNVGCIPSKALLQSSEKYVEAKSHLAEHGITVGDVGLDLAKMMGRKDRVVADLVKGIDFLFRKNKVERIAGAARFTAPGQIAVRTNGSEATYAAQRVLIATGSESMPLPGVEVDEKRIVTSTGALALAEVPKHLVVVGGGYIGLEMGSVWRRLGAEVTVVEFLDTILPNMDGSVANLMHRVLERQGLKFKLGTKVVGSDRTASGVSLTLEPAKGGARETLACDVVLVSIGRRPFTEGLGLETIGVARDNRGTVNVDGSFRTNVDNVYAIGDVAPGPMLAHKAEDEGIAAVEGMAGQATHINYDAIPAVVYTWPEAASVGRSEEALKKDGVSYKVGKFPFTANSRARANGYTEGLVKILADGKTDAILGVHIVGPDAGTMIAELALAMEFGASAEDIARTSHAHPTLNEAVREAALAVGGAAIHV
jgi:dihydrolipoamide dehydrogenase